MTAGPIESALVVPVPEAEPAVGAWRRELDSSAGWGVPAHITVLYPFLAPESVDRTVVRRLRSMFDDVAAFSFVLDSVAWFGEDVVWLRPDPDGPFRRLTERVVAEWPECPPYGGEILEPTPHLTVGDMGSLDDRRRAGNVVSELLPIDATAHQVVLMTGAPEPDSWRIVEAFPLAPPR